MRFLNHWLHMNEVSELRSERYMWLWLRGGVFVLLAALYFVRLGSGSLWDNSEPTYGEIVKEMFRTGDWITMHFNFAPWYIHPPLWFWIAGGAVKAFGLNELSLRLPSAIFGLLGAGATYLAARRLYGEIAGLIAALALGTSLEYIVLCRLAILDTTLVFFMTVTFFWGYFALRDGDRRAFWIAVVAAALGTLTKGPVALVLPLLSLLVYLWWAKAWQQVQRLPWAIGFLAYVLIAGSWFAAETGLHGQIFIIDYFGASTFGRYLQPFENQPGPVYYYIPLLAVGFFPYVAFLPKAIKEAVLRRSNDDIFLLASAIVPLVFFSAAQTKLPNYIVVIFPMLAVLVGGLVCEAIAANQLKPLRGALFMLPVSLVLLTIGVVLYLNIQVSQDLSALTPALALLGWIVVPTAALTLVATLVTKRVWLAPLGFAAMMVGLIGALVIAILPGVEAQKPMKAMAAHIQSLVRPGDKIGIASVRGGFSLLFYTDNHGITFFGKVTGALSPWSFFGQKARVFAPITAAEYYSMQLMRVKSVYVWLRTPSMWLASNRPPP